MTAFRFGTETEYWDRFSITVQFYTLPKQGAEPTYSVAGAQLGTKLLWTALLTWPLMAAVQMMGARIGMVTANAKTNTRSFRFSFHESHT
jgi:Natural resistance-associated macrophage protein